MGKYTKKCSEVAVMEVAQAGVLSRGRDMAVEEALENSGSVKRRKVSNGELRLSKSKSIKAHDSGDVITTSKKFGDLVEEDLSDSCGDAIGFSSGDVQASCCSSNGSINEKLKSADLEEEAEIEANARNNLDSRESTPTSEFTEKPDELESLSKAKPSVLIDTRRTLIPAEKMPPAAELEEFFAAAEKDLHKRFKDKYNFDVVKDVPLNGRFEWVELNP